MHMHPLDARHHVLCDRLPEALLSDPADFERLWGLHPEGFHRIRMGGRLVNTPRWQQAYGADYAYTGQVNRALPISAALAPYLSWARRRVEPRLNGLLLNWYDGSRGHYIGRHRDSLIGMVPDTPIVTLSLGETRVFRLRPFRGQGFVDLTAASGSVIVIPWTTNQSWTHEVPKAVRYTGRRISITLRAFTA